MKRILLALLLTLVAPALSFADMGLEYVSKERAKKLGMDLRLKTDHPTGASEVWVELEFKAEGELKDFRYVSLEIKDGDKLVLTAATLEKREAKPGHILVACMVNRAFLDKVTLRVITGQRMDYTARDIQLKTFADLVKNP